MGIGAIAEQLISQEVIGKVFQTELDDRPRRRLLGKPSSDRLCLHSCPLPLAKGWPQSFEHNQCLQEPLRDGSIADARHAAHGDRQAQRRPEVHA